MLRWNAPPCLLRVVLVNLIEEPDTAIRGVLWRARGPWLVLRDAALCRPNVEPQRIDGQDVIVHRDNVSFIATDD